MPSINVNLTVEQLNILLFILKKESNIMLNEISNARENQECAEIVNELIDKFMQLNELKNIFIY